MALTTGDKVGIGIGALVAVGIGYELFFNKPKFTIYSAVDNKLHSSSNYNTAVNEAGGFNVALTSGNYFIYTTGTGSNTPTATGFAYQWGSTLTNGVPNKVTLASIGYTLPSGIKAA